MKAFRRQRIPESICARKETVDIDIPPAVIQAVFHVSEHFWVRENWQPKH